MNGIHSALRDLSTDAAAGLCTTARFFGAHMHAGRQRVPRQCRVYANCLHALLLVPPLAVVSTHFGSVSPISASCEIAVVIAAAVSWAGLQLVLRPASRWWQQVWRLHLVVILAPIFMVALCGTTVAIALAVVVVFLVPMVWITGIRPAKA